MLDLEFFFRGGGEGGWGGGGCGCGGCRGIWGDECGWEGVVELLKWAGECNGEEVCIGKVMLMCWGEIRGWRLTVVF